MVSKAQWLSMTYKPRYDLTCDCVSSLALRIPKPILHTLATVSILCFLKGSMLFDSSIHWHNSFYPKFSSGVKKKKTHNKTKLKKKKNLSSHSKKLYLLSDSSSSLSTALSGNPSLDLADFARSADLAEFIARWEEKKEREITNRNVKTKYIYIRIICSSSGML